MRLELAKGHVFDIADDEVVIQSTLHSNKIAKVVHPKRAAHSAISVAAIIGLHDVCVDINGRGFNKRGEGFDVLIPFRDKQGINLTLEALSISDVRQFAANQHTEAKTLVMVNGMIKAFRWWWS